jgi:hypothetical protein
MNIHTTAPLLSVIAALLPVIWINIHIYIYISIHALP